MIDDLLRQLEGWTDKDGHHPGLLAYQGPKHAMKISMTQLAWIEPQYPTTASGSGDTGGSRSTSHNDLSTKLAVRPDRTALEAEAWATACRMFTGSRKVGNVTEAWQWHEVVVMAKRFTVTDLTIVPPELTELARTIRIGATARAGQEGQTHACGNCSTGTIKPHQTWCSNMACDRNKDRCQNPECRAIVLPGKLRAKGTLCQPCYRKQLSDSHTAPQRLFGNGTCTHATTEWVNGHKRCMSCLANVGGT